MLAGVSVPGFVAMNENNCFLVELTIGDDGVLLNKKANIQLEDRKWVTGKCGARK